VFIFQVAPCNSTRFYGSVQFHLSRNVVLSQRTAKELKNFYQFITRNINSFARRFCSFTISYFSLEQFPDFLNFSLKCCLKIYHILPRDETKSLLSLESICGKQCFQVVQHFCGRTTMVNTFCHFRWFENNYNSSCVIRAHQKSLGQFHSLTILIFCCIENCLYGFILYQPRVNSTKDVFR
jgi:hypothetical protein